MIMLEALPLELVYQICDWLMRDDVQVLALTCRTIARRTKPLRFPSIRVTNLDWTLLDTLQSDPEMASAVREVILDLPAEFDPYAPKVSDEILSKCRGDVIINNLCRRRVRYPAHIHPHRSFVRGRLDISKGSK